jgi:hypothetical protein
MLFYPRNSRFQTCIEFDHDFPDGTEAQLNIFKRTIEFSESGYDALCCGNPRSRFTGAHEAYLVLIISQYHEGWGKFFIRKIMPL